MAQDNMRDIQKAIEEKRAVVGLQQTMKSLKKGTAQVVYMSANCPAASREDIQRYAALGNIGIIQLTQAADELGAVCKKPFGISVLAVVNV